MEIKFNLGKSPWFYFLWALTIFFVICKVFEVGAIATWSWWWVFAPIWGPIALGLALMLIGIFLYVILQLIIAIFT